MGGFGEGVCKIYRGIRLEPGRTVRSKVGGAVTEKAESGEFFDAADLRGNEDGGLAGGVWHGDFNGGIFLIAFAAAEAEAAFGDVVALDDFIMEIDANAGSELDASADVAATIRFAATGERGRSSGFCF